MNAKYVHTNITARDWRKLAAFYSEVFGCVPKLPERDITGEWIDRLTGLEDVRLRGVHLALPGFGIDGPTLEIFSYDSMAPGTPKMPNHPGYGHIAFAVDDVGEALVVLKAAGGSAAGEAGSTIVPGVGRLSVVYARDPEGNIVELQKWSQETESRSRE